MCENQEEKKTVTPTKTSPCLSWRTLVLGPIFGQNRHVLTTLPHAGKQSKLPHGYLLCFLFPVACAQLWLAPLVAAGAGETNQLPTQRHRARRRRGTDQGDVASLGAVPPARRRRLPSGSRASGLCPRSPDRTEQTSDVSLVNWRLGQLVPRP